MSTAHEDSFSLGIDVGGTHTDAVLLDQQRRVVRYAKVASTDDVLTGIASAVHALAPPVRGCTGIFVGSTQTLNALLSRRDLGKVGVLRLASHHPKGLDPGVGWPEDLREAVIAGHATVSGGHQHDGRPLGPVRAADVVQHARRLVQQGAEDLAVVATFGNLHPAHELEVASLLAQAMPLVPVVLSHTASSEAFLERENATILEAALGPALRRAFGALHQVFSAAGCHAPVLMSQNSGHAVSLDEALRRPLQALLAAPHNSLLGAAQLTGLRDAVVADIGGTSTDVGRLQGGRVVVRSRLCHIAGVRVGLLGPHLITRALGGGSVLGRDEDGELTLGPQSVGARLRERGLSYGGPTPTLTCAAIGAGQVSLGGKAAMDEAWSQEALRAACRALTRLYERAAGNAPHLPLVLVGGGAQLLPLAWLPKGTLRPELGSVANAIGAACAEVQLRREFAVTLPLCPQRVAELHAHVLAHAREAGAVSPQILDSRVAVGSYGEPSGRAALTVVAGGPRSHRCNAPTDSSTQPFPEQRP